MTIVDDRADSSRAAVPAALASRRTAFERLTQGRLDRAYRLAATILDHDEEAQDAVHDAAMQAWCRWPSLRDESRFDGWFDRIVVNVCRDRLRRRAMSARKVSEFWQPPSGDSPGRTFEQEAIHLAMEALTPDHRIVVVLRYLDDLPLDEIAARTGLREGTVKSRLHYALRELRAAYDAAERGGTNR